MRHAMAILWKQVKDTFKNKTILIQFIMFRAITIVMENAVKIEGMPEHFFATLFAGMYLGMAPLTSMAAIIAEEKEKNTLRVLLMSNVKPGNYLLGIGLYIWFICMIGAAVIGVAGKYTGASLADFMLLMCVGIIVSILIGAVIGVASKTQMMATSVTVPVMMIFSFLPMLAMFNEGIAKISELTYTGQIHILLGQAGDLDPEPVQLAAIGANLLLAVAMFAIFYRKKGLE